MGARFGATVSTILTRDNATPFWCCATALSLLGIEHRVVDDVGRPGGSAAAQKEHCMFEILILVPIRDNGGDDFPEAAFALFEELLVDRFGGFTRYPGTTTGGWAFGGRVYRDEARVYGFVVKSIGCGDRVTAIAAFAKGHFGQEAIFIKYLGIVEIL
jgi:hypothetical protein